jgi:phosphomannomutase
LGQLASAVKDAKADLGVATDSDGDRALFVTDRGEVLWGDITGALFAKNELKSRGGGRVITTVNTSSLIQLLCREYDGDLTVTKVGPPAMAEALRNYPDSVFAVEESGKYIWPRILWYGDAALASGKLLQIMKNEQKSLDELQQELPKLHRAKCAIPCPEELKSQALEYALDTWKERNDSEISTIDGFKISYPNGSWILARASGTEPALRCYAESQNSDEAEKLLETVAQQVRKAIERAGKAGSP